jgi:hypothetical protein
MSRRIVIDRLELDLRGVDPDIAEAAVRLLGPALQQQFAQAAGRIADATAIDAGRIAPPSEPQALAHSLAQRIAQSTQES